MTTRTPRIIFLNRFFYPDLSATSEILSDLAFALAERGFRVIAITSRLNYDDPSRRLPARETIRGVEIFRVWTTAGGRRHLTGRLLDYASFYITAAWRLWRLVRRGDVVVAKTDPPLISVIAAIVAWLKGAQLVNWQQDVFPEVAEALGLGGLLGRAGFGALRPLRDWSLRRGHQTVVLGNRMAKVVKRRGIAADHISIIPNWAAEDISPLTEEENSLRREWGLSGRFVVGYAGNLGRAHDIETILAAMRIFKDAALDEQVGNLSFLFVGGGALRSTLEAEIERIAFSNVIFRDYQPRDRLNQVLAAADVHLVMLNPKLEGLIVPSKIYPIAAAGRPVIFIGSRSGEVAQLIAKQGWGFCVEPSYGEQLAQRILQLALEPHLRKLMCERARHASLQALSRAGAIARWEALLDSLNTDPERGRSMSQATERVTPA